MQFLARYVLKLSLGLAAILTPLPVLAAENITFFAPPFGQFDVSIKDLEIFAETGKVTPSFSFYAQRVSEEQLIKLRNILNKQFFFPEIDNQIEVYNFLRSSFGQEIIGQISKIIASPSAQSQPRLRAALIQASANPQDFNLVTILQKYDSPTIPLNLQVVVNTVDEVDEILDQTKRVFNWVAQQPSSQVSNNKAMSLSSLIQPGQVNWSKESLTVNRPNKDPITVNVYLPKNIKQPAPVIVIAPGLNSDTSAFVYIAEHLASHGFGIVAVNFPESDNQRLSEALAGLDTLPTPNAWMAQPQDITLVLDTITQKSQSDPNWQGKLNLNNVGVLGHSLGGYTVTAIGGGKVDWNNLMQVCQNKLTDPNQVTLNPAILWQCKGMNSSPPPENLQDPRIKAVIAINPVINPILSEKGLGQMNRPIMIIGGSNDIFAPPLSEQIRPFTWLTNPDKYLVLVKNSTHLSFSQGTDDLPPAIVGPDLALARSYLKALSVAFFDTYLNNNPESAPYLSDRGVNSISQDSLPIYLLRSLTPEQLQEASQIKK